MQLEPGNRYRLRVDAPEGCDHDTFVVLVDAQVRFAMVENGVFAGFYMQAVTIKLGSPPLMLTKDRLQGNYLKYKLKQIAKL